MEANPCSVPSSHGESPEICDTNMARSTMTTLPQRGFPCVTASGPKTADAPHVPENEYGKLVEGARNVLFPGISVLSELVADFGSEIEDVHSPQVDFHF